MLSLPPLLFLSLLFVNVCAIGNWIGWGGDLNNARNAQGDITITASNAHELTVKWSYPTLGAITTTPTVDNNNVYFVDWLGGLYCLSRDKGELVWFQNISLLLNFSCTARASLAISGEYLVSGIYTAVNANENLTTGHAPPYVFCLNKTTGALLWQTLVHPHPWAAIGSSPIIYQNKVIVGSCSRENDIVRDLNYPCCSYRGAVIGLDLATGVILFREYLIPENGGVPGGFAGAGVWGNSPAIDTKRGLIYVATGQLYAIPKSVTDCFHNSSIDNTTCIPPGVHFDEVIGLSLIDGSIQTTYRERVIDAWNYGCRDPVIPEVCPDPMGDNYDFAMLPIFIDGEGIEEDMLIITGKSGIAWGLEIIHNAQNQPMLVKKWSTQVGPGGVVGGSIWGGAYDGKTYFVPLSNLPPTPFYLQPQNVSWSNGAWSALDPHTGEILWQTPATTNAGVGERADGPVASSGGVAFGCSFSGEYVGLDAQTGQILWKFSAGVTCVAGPAIVDGTIYWGNGYDSRSNRVPTPGKMYAFSLP